ncbi:hypothetical protein CLAFUW4_04943 [Fulvia fulva]|uniref:Uncharacterized protein n=1 Tax=Passalora fulva TaxID=5499 RepID=A0A9Q8PIX1_PASFU|nr:uncharacterized protein CLAFUR5_11963 [Fulvia fulva]KAK4626574.1 hypothetical protein CLAFUR4_04929 [Fulvia fulva]KAK4628642.1 hypothetical protein CLAFUR0_04933 [Fulvia fulva]UJO23283.1 hypothetical protein CLAFUR5_11963 [Fulvia fulva]WPV13776.1 hypothetical protein CLAFUW4_04943 [Fulvia fulva]WPV29268.1 hypothetical protein CLAFUW7_04937 [Fulvia fulva]
MSSIFDIFNQSRQPDLPLKHNTERIEIPTRRLVAQDAANPSIVSLGHDLIVMILQVLQDAHPPSMRSVKQVSSNFHHLAAYIACNTLKLDLSLKASVATSDRLLRLEQRGLLAAIHRIEVTATDDELAQPMPPSNGNHFAKQDDCKVMYLMRRLLLLMTGLTDLHWPNESISPATLAILKGRAVRLHVKADSYATNNLDRLIDCSNLHSLSVHQNYASARDCLKITGPLKAVLLSCKNLRHLSFDISQPSSGCVVYSVPTEYCGMGFVDGEKPPALESLNVYSYPFRRQQEDGDDDDDDYQFSVGYPGRGTEQEYWIENFDWSRLRVLEVNDASLALGLMSKLPMLEEVSLKHVYPPAAIKEFYSGVPTSLKSIEAQKLSSVGLAGIVRHGSALRKLQLHQHEGWNRDWKEEAIDNSSLMKVRDECPFIEELHLDIGRSGEWPFDILDTIATFPALRSLTIWLELGMGKDEELATPKVTFSSVEDIFKYLRQRSPTQPSKLRELQVYSGSPPGLGHGYPSAMAFWPQYNSMHFRCSLSERDDEAALGIYTTECPELGAQANEYLRGERETFTPSGEYGFMDDTEQVEVAKDGPKSRDEWKAHY